MRGRLVVFPVKGRNWCFSRSVEPLVSESASSLTPSTFKQLWHRVSSSKNSNHLELLIDFISLKMNRAWVGLEMAPQGSLKNKIHGLGLKLLARVKPSEIFLKSISKEVTDVEVNYPSRGTIIHKNYFYGSVSLLPLTFVFSVLPLPNIPFFWILFRTYSHWRALQGSEKLLVLVSDHSGSQNFAVSKTKASEDEQNKCENETNKLLASSWVLKPSSKLDELVSRADKDDGLSKCVISEICKMYKLNTIDVVKYRNSV
ncbi:uncharacterized protein LOC123211495 isoform X2 [Mangifera indica]|uniref:uncharacterized protein LOC123211495 isoform X2 n=1 Tax=Mangifera indica TaxID=29780 RepID=UPI001CFB6F35|nr:uncharacterized protein LOC123211495 isoform X2 [Mangifera indica]